MHFVPAVEKAGYLGDHQVQKSQNLKSHGEVNKLFKKMDKRNFYVAILFKMKQPSIIIKFNYLKNYFGHSFFLPTMY
ncbi:orph-I3 [Microplitis demolitor]|nr:orph-I3 [Microplitis demolitor]